MACPDDVDVDLSNFDACFLSYEDFLPGFKKPTCPCCKSNGKVSRHGWATTTKRVFSVFRDLVIFSAQYKCANCPASAGKFTHD